jgi:hypothetical protein
MTNFAFPRAWRIIGTACDRGQWLDGMGFSQHLQRNPNPKIPYAHLLSIIIPMIPYYPHYLYHIVYIYRQTDRQIVYYIMLYYITLHFITLHYITLYYIILYYIILYYICYIYIPIFLGEIPPFWEAPVLSHQTEAQSLQEEIGAFLYRQTSHEEKHGIHDVEALDPQGWDGMGYTCLHVYIYIYAYLYISISISISVSIYLSICLSIYLYIYDICVCVCAHVNMYRYNIRL